MLTLQLINRRTLFCTYMEMCIDYVLWTLLHAGSYYFFTSLRILIGKIKNVKVDIEEILQRSVDNDDVSMSVSFGDGDDIIMANRDRSVCYIHAYLDM
jgi:hypothetical protein